MLLSELGDPDTIAVGGHYKDGNWAWERPFLFDRKAIGWYADLTPDKGDCLGVSSNVSTSAVTFNCVEPKRIMCSDLIF